MMRRLLNIPGIVWVAAIVALHYLGAAIGIRQGGK
jgi:hypothetical protein